MARFAPVLLAALFAAAALSAQPRDDPNKSIDRVLAIQAALYQGRQHLQKGDAKQAVAALEAELPNSNGNRDYLAALRDAYWAYVKELQRSQQTEQAAAILGRLRKLDPSAKLDGIAAVTPAPGAPSSGSAVIPAPETPRKARAKVDGGDPFEQPQIGTTGGAQDLCLQAEQAFAQERFADAGRLFEQANAKDPAALGTSKGRWAFCRLRAATERLNGTIAAGELPALEEETRQSIAMAADKPELQKYGQTVLDRIRSTRGTAAPAANGDWAVVESTNFRVLYRSARDSAERFSEAAEKSRAAAFEKWFGSTTAAWSPRCDVYLYPSADEYIRVAKGHPQSHGYTTVEMTGSKPARRRIDLAGDNPHLLTAALPREVTHVVLADLFPDPLLPRWADEAMAILAEPRPNVERYLRAVPRCRRDGKLLAIGPLLTSSEFPDAAAITGFYAESVSLVDMLVTERGAKAFSIFLQDARRYGYEKALTRNYQIKSFQDLQERWQRHTAAQGLE